MNPESQPPVRRYHLKRVALEWACLAFMASALLLAAGWIYTGSDETDLLGLNHFASWGPHDLDLIVGRGQLAACHRFDNEGMGRALQIDPRTPGVPIRWNGKVQVPGLRIRCEQFARTGAPMVWDVRISLLIPAALCAIAASFCRRSLSHLRRNRTQPSRPDLLASLRAG